MVAPQQWHRVVAKLAFRCRRVGFETVSPVPEQFKPIAIVYYRIEGRQKANNFRCCLIPCVFIRGPVPVELSNARVRQALFGSAQRRRQFISPLRRGKAQTSQIKRKTGTRQRRIDANDDVNECIDAWATVSDPARNWCVLVNRINANTFFSSHDTE